MSWHSHIPLSGMGIPVPFKLIHQPSLNPPHRPIIIGGPHKPIIIGAPHRPPIIVAPIVVHKHKHKSKPEFVLAGYDKYGNPLFRKK